MIDNLYCKYAHSSIQHIICDRNVFTNFLPCSHAIIPNNETCLVTCAHISDPCFQHWCVHIFLLSFAEPGYNYIRTYIPIYSVCLYMHCVCMCTLSGSFTGNQHKWPKVDIHIYLFFSLSHIWRVLYIRMYVRMYILCMYICTYVHTVSTWAYSLLTPTVCTVLIVCTRSLAYDLCMYVRVQKIFRSLCRYNKLAHIPESVRACVMLEELSLDGNVLTDLPVRINRGDTSLLAHLTTCTPHHMHASPHAHLTACTPHRMHTSPHAHLTACTPHHMHTSPHAHLTTCTPHRMHTSPHSHLTAFTPHHMHTSPHAHLTTCTPPHAHLTTCTPHHMHTSPHAHLTAFTPHRIHTSPHAHLTTCTSYCMHTSPPAHLTTCTLHRMHTSPHAYTWVPFHFLTHYN